MRRWLFFAILCLALGAVVNVLVAWGLAVWASPLDAGALPPSAAWREDEEFAWFVPPPDGWPPAATAYVAYRGAGQTSEQAIAESIPQRRFCWMFRTSYGWPAHSLYRVESGDPVGRNKVRILHHRSVESPPWLSPAEWPLVSWPHPFQLPVGVNTVAFAMNAAVYGALVALIAMFVLRLRRATRLWRGCCARCGYDLRGIAVAVCPECGRAIRRGPRARHAAASPRDAVCLSIGRVTR